ncbi:hypothetical protein SLA2020_223670 [Shorea laevis]
MAVPLRTLTSSLVFLSLLLSFTDAREILEAYQSCNTTNPVAEYKDGNTKVKLDRPGPFYFISGAKGHCEQGHKLIVVVLTPRHRYTAISPAPAPAEFEGPAIAPTSSATSIKAGLVTLGLLVLALF